MTAGDSRRLRVDLRVEADAGFDCPIVSLEGVADADAVRINAVGDDCTVDVESSEGSVVSSSGRVDEDCLCRCLQAFDCVPHVADVDGRAMLVRTYVEDRETVRDLVGALREAVGDVHLERLAVVDGSDCTEEATVDLSALTAKQREALELAVLRGYFEGDAALADLASELGVSKSAVSQRLRTAESKLVRMALRSR